MMPDRKNIILSLCLLALITPFQIQAAVTVYCCDAAAETQYIQDLNALQSVSVDLTTESFESDAWADTRITPRLNVTTQSITWEASSTEVAGVRTSTAGGDVHEGSYLMFAADVNNSHLRPDKIRLTANGITLYGVGGWFRSSGGAELNFTTNSGAINFPDTQSTVFDWTFLGFIDDSGISTLLIEAVEEDPDEIKIFFSDDFTLAAGAGAFPGEDLEFSAANYTISENAGSATITVVRNGGTSGELSVDYTTSLDSMATEGQDFVMTSGTLVFADGETSKQFTVDIIDDNVYEGDETVDLILTGSSVGITNTATLTITENDLQSFGSVGFSGSRYTIDENGGSATITVQRIDGTSGSGSVDYTTSDGTATAGSDYTAASGTLSFIDGQNSASFNVDILDDTSQEGTESIILSLSNPVSVSLGTVDFSEISILDNETPPSAGILSFSGTTYSFSEADSEMVLPILRSSGSSGAVSVLCMTLDSSAVAGSDFTATNSTVNFTDGELIKECRVPILNDSTYENDENLLVTLASVSGGAALGTPSNSTVTIQDDDPLPAAGGLQFSLLNYEQLENGGMASIAVSRVGGSSGSVSVNYSTSDGTALAGSDYTATSGTLSFAAGTTAASFQIPLLDDATFEGAEDIVLTLSNPTGGAVLGSPAESTLTVTDDEQVPLAGSLEFALSEYSADEFDGVISVEVVRQNGSSGVASVNYATSDASATAGLDYEVSSGTLTFNEGEISKNFQVNITDDVLFEGTEEINLTLSNAFSAVLGDITTSKITINDDDTASAAGVIELSQAGYTVSEDGNTIDIAVTRTSGSTGAVSVDYTTQDSTAIVAKDYSFTTGTISFASGDSTNKTISVPIINDVELEGDEQFTLTLSNVQGGAALGTNSSSSVTITDDDIQSSTAVFSFSVDSLRVDETASSATITIQRNDFPFGTVTVDISAASITAVAGVDYNVATGTLQFNDGEVEKVVTVEIIDNTLSDGDRTITFTLSNATGMAVIDQNNNSLALTIIDDEQTSSSGGGGGGGGSISPILFLILVSGIMLLYRRDYRSGHIQH